jgi:hypothetical protein
MGTTVTIDNKREIWLPVDSTVISDYASQNGVPGYNGNSPLSIATNDLPILPDSFYDYASGMTPEIWPRVYLNRSSYFDNNSQIIIDAISVNGNSFNSSTAYYFRTTENYIVQIIIDDSGSIDSVIFWLPNYFDEFTYTNYYGVPRTNYLTNDWKRITCLPTDFDAIYRVRE